MIRNRHFLKICMLIIFAFTLQPVVSVNVAKYTIDKPILFSIQGDSAIYSFDIKVNTNLLKNNSRLELTPMFVYSEQNDTTYQSLKTASFEGELYSKLGVRKSVLNKENKVPKGNENEITNLIHFSGAIPYNKTQEIIALKIEQAELGCCETTEYPADFYDIYIEGGFNPVFLPSTVVSTGELSDNLKSRKVSGKAFIHFEINDHKIDLSKADNKNQIELMLSEFGKIIKDPYATFDSALIKAQSSPDGPFEFNNKLANKRANSAVQYLKNELVNLKIKKMNSQFISSYTPEAWDELYDEIETSDMDSNNKRQVLNILKNTPIHAEREYLLRQKHVAYQYIKTHLLGKIRRVDYSFYLTFQDLTFEEQMKMLHTRPDIYSPIDFLVVVNHLEDYEEKVKTIELAIRYYPENIEILTSFLDLLIKNNQKEKAFDYLFELDNKENYLADESFLRNASLVCLLNDQDDFLASMLATIDKSALTDSTQIEEINYWNAMVLLRSRDYINAYTLLKSRNDINTARCLVGMKKYSEAWVILDDISCNTGAEYYFKAMAAAYNNKELEAIELLKLAFDKDSSLNDLAKKEFVFKSILEQMSFNNINQ